MLATLGGSLALMLGLTVLLLPVLATELSRPRDSFWGGVVLLLGLVLVTSAERLRGAPMLAVLCGGLLVGRLGLEVGQARWRQLSPEEQQRLWSSERWQKSLAELGASLARLLQLVGGLGTGLLGWVQQRRQPRPTTKRWVRLEPAAAPGPADPASPSPEREGSPGGAEAAETPADGEESERAEPAADSDPPDAPPDEPAATAAVVVVDSLEGVEALLHEQEGSPPGPQETADDTPQPHPRPPAGPAAPPGETG